MNIKAMRLIFLSLLLLLIPLLASCTKEKQVYIVYFGEHKGDKAFDEIEAHHHSYLQSVKESEEDAKSSLLYSYKHSINGFAAELTADQASRLKGLRGVLSVFKSNPRKYKLHTTRSWEFVGLKEDEGEDYRGDGNGRRHKYDMNDRFRVGRKFLNKAKHGDGVIVGLIDSGVWPESRSFDDKGMGPIPESWNGICQTGVAFNSSHCNRKIIGARYYARGYERYYGPFNAEANNDFLSPRDADGHGSHTASTAVGRRVKGVSALGGIAMGTASGGASLARLAVYKACWAIPNAEKYVTNTCFDEDMLAAFDDAIADGVNVISISIGAVEPQTYLEDGIAIGALHAVKRDIVVAASAGNDGPAGETLSNPAPWIITVGASSLDRFFVGGLELGDGYKFESDSLTTLKMDNFAPLVYAPDVVVPWGSRNEASLCLPNSLSPDLVKGKVVLCLRGFGSGSTIGKGLEVKRAGGVGMILANSRDNDAFDVVSHFVPTALVFSSTVDRILDYIYNDYEPVAFIKPAETILYRNQPKDSFYPYKPAPFMTSFSSRGPNWVDANILKPDIIAPGLNILAAWSGADSASKDSIDQRVSDYSLDSGTSMACPHVAGAIALLKSMHPTWSSAAIRSALMTTASMTNQDNEPIQDYDGSPANPFALGSGHFRPTKAASPGLVYDASYGSYLLYCCSVGLTNIDPTFKCPSEIPPGYNLNYPSISIPYLIGTVTVTRTVTCVGRSANSTSVYVFKAQPPFGVNVKAEPNVLVFDRIGQKKQFNIIFTTNPYEFTGEARRDRYRFGWFSWSDGHHVVRSPIAVSLV
ncbi:PREDICTED: subtilisin-like protease SBT5.5 [Camelina sativa]|uniref:Subtilisin-like protease SBT5.5 n=1 Tax=Camelina sativa TaxID=90675 RepID=A0ABM0Y315_CAMSA|nr:PREDICTED: subtilisin-like protease SBT5.5 [Camelina sativa]